MSNLAIELLVTFSVVVVILLAARPLLLRQFGPTQTYQLWLAVPLCLIAPFIPAEAKISMPLQQFEVFKITASSDTTLMISTHDELYLLVYCVGVAFGAALMFFNGLSQLNRTQLPLSAPEKRALVLPKIPVYYNDAITSPMLEGIFKPVIYLPVDFFQRYTSFQQKAIIRHELYHHHRKDILYTFIANLLVILFWFNPLSWLAYRVFKQDQELSCDEAVLKGEGNNSKQEYARALLASELQSRPLTLHTSFGKKGNAKMMRERISTIKQTGSYSRLFALCGMLFVALVSTTQLQADNMDELGSQPEESSKVATPIVSVSPIYPAQAKKYGIEGWVVLEFGITAHGTVENIRVIESHPSDVFDDAAKKAVAKWRYMPSNLADQVNTVELEFSL